MELPSVPDETYSKQNHNIFRIKTWKKAYAIAVLSSLLTEPRFHANVVRLDWLQRLVLSKAEGKQKPTSKEFGRVLNAGLEQANVAMLEDPIEDLFCDIIATTRGNFRFFPGQWESAGACTQVIIEAFEALPDGPVKQDALTAAYTLLKLSDTIARSAGAERGAPSESHPWGEIRLPGNEALKKLARRVQFSFYDLERIGIQFEGLRPFIMDPGLHSFTSDREIGNTPLEFYPLLSNAIGIIVASPINLTLAARAALIDAAESTGMGKTLQSLMLKSQEKYAEATGFWPTGRLRLSELNQYSLRASVCQYDEGRYLQSIQVPCSFDGFPHSGFATVRSLSPEAANFIAEEVLKFWKSFENRRSYRKSLTVIILSGWGAPQVVDLNIREHHAPKSWQLLYVSFSDAAILGACDEGKLSDIARLLDQHDRLEKDGFSFVNPSGLLNMFGFWHRTNGNLIPEHMWDMAPPCLINIPTDELFEPRRIGILRRDCRALPTPNNEFKIVQRMNWGEDEPQSIFISIDDLSVGQFHGAIAISGRTWWIESIAKNDEDGGWRYQVCNALLQWLAAVGATLIDRYPDAFLLQTRGVFLEIPEMASFNHADVDKDADIPLYETIIVNQDDPDGTGVVQIKHEWLAYLRVWENDAEVELVAAFLELIAMQGKQRISRTEIGAILRDVIGSADWRWLHAHKALTPLDRMAAHGLISRFELISFSAFASVKCRSVWDHRDRALGFEIIGEDQCKQFLEEYRDEVLSSLIRDIRRYKRADLAIASAKAYQAARHEQSRWREAVRALRAIRGEKADETAFKRQNAINAVRRAAKTICEVAACEGQENGGLTPGRADIEEMYAKALLLFSNSHLFPAIRADLIPATLRVSPAGDILCERDVFNKALGPGVLWLNTGALNEAASAYVKHRGGPEVPKGKGLEWDAGLRAAIEAEYHVSVEAYVDLQFALTQLAERRDAGVFLATHSTLAQALKENIHYLGGDFVSLLERLTLRRRSSWHNGLQHGDLDLSRFDRPSSLINRPLLMLDDRADPLVLVAPALVADSIMYAISGLVTGQLNNTFWESTEARRYAGIQGEAAGYKFEERVATKLRELGLDARVRCKLSALLNQKVDPKYGDVDVLAVTPDQKNVWVIEAKNLKLCRTVTEVASRLSEYRGRMTVDAKGASKPDKLLRHIKRVEYLRARTRALSETLRMKKEPEVKGLVIVDAPQPMNFHMLDSLADGASVFLDIVETFDF